MKRSAARLFLFYLRVAAKLQLRKIRPRRIIGVGGSAGKTSLVAALHAAMAGTCRVRSGGGVNSETGIPFGILGIRMDSYSPGGWFAAALQTLWALLTDWNKYDVYVAELGIDGPEEPKNMTYMLKIVRPDIGVLTNIALEHSEYFEKSQDAAPPAGSVLDRIATEEEKLLTSLSPTGTAVVNLDDPRIVAALPRIRAEQVSVSLTNPEAVFFGKTATSTLESFYLEIIFRGQRFDLRLSKPLSRAYAMTLLLAVATAHSAGVPVTEAIRGITECWELPGGRLSVFSGINNTTIIDSTYNATPVAMRDALGFLQETAHARRRVAVLGDMRELGKAGEEEHRALAPLIHAAAQHAVLIGPQMRAFVAPELEKLGASYEAFDTFTEARDAIQKAAQPHSVVLVKGSQNTLFLERAVEMLVADESDVAKLCRRGAQWDALRAKTP